MKGKATIILSDALTGREISRWEEHNLVTDAMKNIFNPPHYMLMHEFNYSNLMVSGFPLSRDLLSGIVLLGNERREDASDFMLGTDTIPVGHAGGEYAGANTARGSLNLNESGPLENGHRFVWDFASDKANGTIKCIGLTSREFGNSGFQAEDIKDGAFFVLPQNIGAVGPVPTGSFIQGAGQYIGTFRPMEHLFAELDAEGWLVFRRYRAFDPSALGMNDTLTVSQPWTPVSEERVKPPFTIVYDNHFFLNTDTRTLYYFCWPNSTDGFATVSYVGYSVDDFTVADSGSITVPYVPYEYFAVYNDHIWLDADNVLLEYDRNGTLVKTHPCVSSGGSALFMVNGCLMQKERSFVRCYSWGDTSCLIRDDQMQYTPTYNADLKPPYTAAAIRMSHSASTYSQYTKPVPVIVSSYLATINNLSQPLEKTSAQTLKIIYDITED